MGKVFVLLIVFFCQSVFADVRDIFQNARKFNRNLSVRVEPPQSVVEILRQEQNVDPDGSYKWAYETSNGIAAQEEGRLSQQGQLEPSTAAQGYFAYTSPEGQPISLSYIADENGFQPSGEHLPTPPPIPVAILRALEWIATHPEQPKKQRF